MTRYIAFLRAINVGGHIVKMAELRQHFVAAGLANVETFIQSGNVIFESSNPQASELEHQIEGYLQGVLGYAVATFLRTPAELTAVAHYQPFPNSEFAASENLYIAFLKANPGSEAHTKLLPFQNESDEFHFHQRELYWLCRKSQSQSNFSGARLEKALGCQATLRSITTVRKMAANYPPNE